jgi:hypothetical protein
LRLVAREIEIAGRNPKVLGCPGDLIWKAQRFMQGLSVHNTPDGSRALFRRALAHVEMPLMIAFADFGTGWICRK